MFIIWWLIGKSASHNISSFEKLKSQLLWTNHYKAVEKVGRGSSCGQLSRRSPRLYLPSIPSIRIVSPRVLCNLRLITPLGTLSFKSISLSSCFSCQRYLSSKVRFYLIQMAPGLCFVGQTVLRVGPAERAREGPLLLGAPWPLVFPWWVFWVWVCGNCSRQIRVLISWRCPCLICRRRTSVVELSINY